MDGIIESINSLFDDNNREGLYENNLIIINLTRI